MVLREASRETKAMSIPGSPQIVSDAVRSENPFN